MTPELSFSHFGMFVTDLDRLEAFYRDVLGFTVTDRGELEGPRGPMNLVFLSRDPDEHHQIVLVSGRPAELAFNPINQISLRADSLPTLRRIHSRLLQAGCRDAVPVTHGNALSVYAGDPEGNRLEVFIDLPWYVTQPLRVPVDFALDDAALMAWLEAHARTQPGFMPRAQWREALVRKMTESQGPG
jgi:catechol 2,3-dioxygenase-like lactoylglutathione lyase family enzyme